MAELKPFAFVLMPFSDDFADIYKFGIQATADENGIVAERVDEQFYSETMLERIYRQIDAADVIIADMSGRNPNVFYEVGYAHAKGKLCTLLTQDAADIPFDLKHHRHLVYDGSIQKLKEMLTAEFGYVKDEIRRRRTTTFSVDIRSANGTLLKREDWMDEGSLELVFDIHNQTERRTPEIEAIYIYTTRQWTFSQNGQECGFRDSGTEGLARQHLLSVPVVRLSQNAWSQIRAVGTKVLWSKYMAGAEERKDEYRIAGHIMLDIVTPEGNFSEKMNLDVTFSEFPF